jgi:hypothetical protein
LNDQFHEDGGPEFLYIGGEGPESGSALIVQDTQKPLMMMKWAKELKARALV